MNALQERVAREQALEAAVLELGQSDFPQLRRVALDSSAYDLGDDEYFAVLGLEGDPYNDWSVAFWHDLSQRINGIAAQLGFEGHIHLRMLTVDDFQRHLDGTLGDEPGEDEDITDQVNQRLREGDR